MPLGVTISFLKNVLAYRLHRRNFGGPQMEYTNLTLAELVNGMVRTATAIRWCREILDGLQEPKTIGMQAVVKALLPKLKEDLKVLDRTYTNAKKRQR